jgi:RimJ/RimL family protein N-acetyltransferase
MTWVNDPDVTGRFARLGHVTREEEQQYLDRISKSERDRLYAVEDEHGEMIGTAGLHDIDPENRTARFGIIIGRKDRWNGGYGRSTITALLNEAYTTGLKEVWGVTRTDNARMRHLLAQSGFREDAYLPARYCQAGTCHDMVHEVYRIGEAGA